MNPGTLPPSLKKMPDLRHANTNHAEQDRSRNPADFIPGKRPCRLIFTDFSFDGTEYFLGIEAYPLLKYPDDLPDVLDLLKNITIDNHKVGSLTDFDGANLIFQSKRLSTVVGCNTYSLNRGE